MVFAVEQPLIQAHERIKLRHGCVIASSWTSKARQIGVSSTKTAARLDDNGKGKRDVWLSFRL